MTRIPVDVELVQLGSDVLVLCLALESLVADNPHQARISEVQLDGEVRSIHFDRLG